MNTENATQNTENLIAPEQLLLLITRAQKAIREIRKNIIGKQPMNSLTRELDSEMSYAKTRIDKVEHKIKKEMNPEIEDLFI